MSHEVRVVTTSPRPAHGHELAGPRWEIYGDWHEDPAQLETEVYYLLR